ncbi:MAG TPA: DoxX family protein [Gammaproteobacteria bacterium]|nr:DoxX family protein [Gammaproteobacteria bacterium]
MTITLNTSRILFGLVLAGLGVLGFMFDDFALVWQRVPAHVPARGVLAYLSAAIELLTGLGLLYRPTVSLACRVLFPFLLLWVVLLKVPALFLAPGTLNSWAGFGEIGIVLAGGWCLYSMNAGEWDRRHLGFVVGAKGLRAARVLFIVCLPLIGLVHLVESGPVAAFIPAWLPFRLALAYITGAASFAAAAGLLLGIWPRLAATLETVMLGCISVLCWGPLLSTGRTANTAFLISWAITLGAWLVADTYRGTTWFATGKAVWKRSP